MILTGDMILFDDLDSTTTAANIKIEGCKDTKVKITNLLLQRCSTTR